MKAGFCLRATVGGYVKKRPTITRAVMTATSPMPSQNMTGLRPVPTVCPRFQSLGVGLLLLTAVASSVFRA